jgi:ribonuclease P protein component
MVARLSSVVVIKAGKELPFLLKKRFGFSWPKNPTSNLMLTKQHRLAERNIQLVKDQGRHYQTPFFTLVYLAGRKTPSQFAFVLSKRVDKRATMRNKTKRLLAGSVRDIIGQSAEGYWLIFLVKPTAINQSKEVLSSAIEEAFSKIGLKS